MRAETNHDRRAIRKSLKLLGQRMDCGNRPTGWKN